MRDIKFRAFRDGKMYYDDDYFFPEYFSRDLKQVTERCNITNKGIYFLVCETRLPKKNEQNFDMALMFEPESLMQFIGLKDKNGKDVYEGDIVKKVYYPLGVSKDVIEYYKLGVVTYNKNSFGVCLKIDGTNVLDESKKRSYHKTKKEVYSHPTQGLNWIDNMFSYGKCEIIGNIYENPDLL